MLNEVPFTPLDDAMSFGGEFAFQIGDAAGIFQIDFPARFEGAPVRCDFLFTFIGGFVGGVRGDPGEDAGGDGARDGRVMPLRECFAECVDGGEFAFGHATHQFIDFNGRGNHERARAPTFAPGAVDR